MSDFYDRLASLYHLIFQDWNASIERQAGQLASIIEERWGSGCRTILDVSCGIGTQALGLAGREFVVTASDLSAGAISRAIAEAQQQRALQIDFQVWDFVGDVYDLAMYFVVDDRASEQLVTHVMRTKYSAVGTDHLLGLMCRAGFTEVERLDWRFYQPVLVGNRDA
jgi:SAM-dependent methyltransferase